MGKPTCDFAPFIENCYLNYKLNREYIVANAPVASGVYGLYNAVWIFVGEADNIRLQLLEHLSGDEPWVYRYRPSGFAFELVQPEARYGRYLELIGQTEPLVQTKARASKSGEILRQ
jgi:hypothetical protein